jgi:hypothetical protein
MLYTSGHDPNPPGGPPRKPVEPPPTFPDPGVPDPRPIDNPRPPQPDKVMRGVWSLLDERPPPDRR